MANLSSRVAVGTGDNAAIAGIIVTGFGPKRVILRAIGPSIGVSGLLPATRLKGSTEPSSAVTGALSDPRLELHDSTGATIVANDNWQDVQAAEIIATGVAPRDNRESAIVRSLDPGRYTAIMRGAGSTTGVGLVEVYDLDPAAPAKLANISTRGPVGVGSNVLIAGFIANGNSSGTVVVRGIGPSTGVPGALADPTLTLYDRNGQAIYANDNWQDSQEGAIRATNLQPLDAREAAILQTLGPGAYTAILAGSGGATGIGLIEVYRISQ